MIAQGEKDAKASIAKKTSVHDLTEFYALIKTKDEQVKGKTFDEFMAMKAAGEAPEVNQEKLALFLQ